MSWIKHKTFALLAACVGMAAVLGGSLGFAAAAHTTNLSTGFNLVGGPLSQDTAPDQFVACLPAGSWNSIYIWDGQNQEWQHYFNTSTGVPSYVNALSVGGISTIRKFAGVVLLMNTSVSNAKLKDAPGDSCS